MSSIKMCSHECDCDCHTGSGVMHVISCCDPCAICGRNIIRGEMDNHLAFCHKGAKNVFEKKKKKRIKNN